jgi:hypothetical protein
MKWIVGLLSVATIFLEFEDYINKGFDWSFNSG